MSSTKAKLTVLISGSGSNLQALIDVCGQAALPNAEIIRVVSNKKAAYGLERAQKAQIPTAYHNLLEYKKRFPDASESKKFEQARSEYDRDLASLVLADKPDIVVCAGWMHILAPTFLEPLKQAGVPVINLHPALPGQFNGAHAIDEAYKAFQEGKIDHTGIMIHYVIQEVDMGEPIVTREIPIRKGESQDELEQRIHENEWELIVQGTRKAIDTLWKSRPSS
ncbi:putative phosphoribosylglycinamide formyltransferase [Aureobasidium subglaciale]|nr:putative phosphoribosylglycinamide formyltransferase [Aureobasidium subglaciale]